MLPTDVRYQYIYDEYEEKKKINRFLEQLKKDLESNFGIKSRVALSGQKKEGRYTIYLNTAYNNDSEKRVELTCTFHMPEFYRLIEKGEMQMNDRDLDILLYNRAELLWVKIEGLYTHPKGIGLGGFVVKELIKFLRDIESIKAITLMPDGEEAKRFWLHMGFTYVDRKKWKDKCRLVDFDLNDTMAYEL